MFSFKFKVNEDHSVNIHGLATGKVTELAGSGKPWRMWNSAGHGYQSGREWRYGCASVWIVHVSEDTMLKHFDFEFGRQWKKGREIIAQIVEQLNQNPDADHMEYLRKLEIATRDWECQQSNLTAIEKLQQAMHNAQ